MRLLTFQLTINNNVTSFCLLLKNQSIQRSHWRSPTLAFDPNETTAAVGAAGERFGKRLRSHDQHRLHRSQSAKIGNGAYAVAVTGFVIAFKGSLQSALTSEIKALRSHTKASIIILQQSDIFDKTRRLEKKDDNMNTKLKSLKREMNPRLESLATENGSIKTNIDETNMKVERQTTDFGV